MLGAVASDGPDGVEVTSGLAAVARVPAISGMQKSFIGAFLRNIGDVTPECDKRSLSSELGSNHSIPTGGAGVAGREHRQLPAPSAITPTCNDRKDIGETNGSVVIDIAERTRGAAPITQHNQKVGKANRPIPVEVIGAGLGDLDLSGERGGLGEAEGHVRVLFHKKS